MNEVQDVARLGLTANQVEFLCGVLKRDPQDFYTYMRGQTVALIGGETVYYYADIVRWINKLQPLD